MAWLILTYVSGGMGFFDLGLRSINVSGINEVLTGYGYDALPSTFLSLGGFGYSLHGKILLGGGGYSLNTGTIRSKDRIFSISGGAGFFEAGYMITRLGPVRLFPILSIGGGGISLTISDTAGVSFDDIVQEGQFRQMNLEGGHVAIGGRLMGIIPLSRTPAGNLALTISAGYTYSPEFSLTSPYVRISDAPTASISGFYFSIGVGGGYMKEEE